MPGWQVSPAQLAAGVWQCSSTAVSSPPCCCYWHSGSTSPSYRWLSSPITPYIIFPSQVRLKSEHGFWNLPSHECHPDSTLKVCAHVHPPVGITNRHSVVAQLVPLLAVAAPVTAGWGYLLLSHLATSQYRESPTQLKTE
jgi:hypothetical protein